MPRDGSNVYGVPPGTHGAPDTTIESARYNAFVDDVAQDLNHPRPIVAGGTGANNAVDAMKNLSGEITNQIVTNYNSDILYSGSFSSATTATGGPIDGHAFAGWIYKTDADNMVIEARDASDSAVPGNLFIREKKGNPGTGVWGPWSNFYNNLPPPVPVGTVMIFYQAAAPTGWTKIVTQNDKVLRVVSGSGGVAGGGYSFSSIAAQTVVGGFALTASYVPNLSVSVSGTTTVSGTVSVSGSASVAGTMPWVTSGMNIGAGGTNVAYAGGTTALGSSGSCSASGGNSMSGFNGMSGATSGGGGAAHNHSINLNMQYVDVILASKN